MLAQQDTVELDMDNVKNLGDKFKDLQIISKGASSCLFAGRKMVMFNIPQKQFKQGEEEFNSFRLMKIMNLLPVQKIIKNQVLLLIFNGFLLPQDDCLLISKHYPPLSSTLYSLQRDKDKNAQTLHHYLAQVFIGFILFFKVETAFQEMFRREIYSYEIKPSNVFIKDDIACLQVQDFDFSCTRSEGQMVGNFKSFGTNLFQYSKAFQLLGIDMFEQQSYFDQMTDELFKQEFFIQCNSEKKEDKTPTFMELFVKIKKEKNIKEKDKNIEEKEQNIEEKQQNIKEKEKNIEEKEQNIEEKEKNIEQKEKNIEEKEQNIEEKEQNIKKKEKNIEIIVDGNSFVYVVNQIPFYRGLRQLQYILKASKISDQVKNCGREIISLERLVDRKEFPTIYGYVRIFDQYFIIMEKYETDLDKVFKDVELKGKFTFEFISRAAFQLIKGLQILYEKQIIHRDLKPSNILVKRSAYKLDFDSYVFVLADFDSSKIHQDNMTNTNMIGTLMYKVPQHYDKYTKKFDVYQMGLIIYQLANNGDYMFPGQDSIKEHQYDTEFTEQKIKEKLGHINNQTLIDFLVHCLKKKEEDRKSITEIDKLYSQYFEKSSLSQNIGQQSGQITGSPTQSHQDLNQVQSILPSEQQEQQYLDINELKPNQDTQQQRQKQQLNVPSNNIQSYEMNLRIKQWEPNLSERPQAIRRHNLEYLNKEKLNNYKQVLKVSKNNQQLQQDSTSQTIDNQVQQEKVESNQTEETVLKLNYYLNLVAKPNG